MIHKNQRGFTLIELVIAIAITGLISGGITMAIFQVFDVNIRTSNRMTAVRQVQNAGFWLSRDTQMAQNVHTIDDPVTPELELVTLTWTDGGGTTHQVVYTLENMSGGLKNLQRSHFINGVPSEPTIVAEFINTDPTKTNVEFDGGVLIFTVTATVGEASETRVYRIVPRPGS